MDDVSAIARVDLFVDRSLGLNLCICPFFNLQVVGSESGGIYTTPLHFRNSGAVEVIGLNESWVLPGLPLCAVYFALHKFVSVARAGTGNTR